MAFHRLVECVERLILGNPPQDEANAALDEIAIRAAKLYVKRATEGRQGFDAKFANWVPTRMVCNGEEKVLKPVIDPFEQDRQWHTMWLHLHAKLACEYPNLFPNIPADFVEPEADVPALLDANGNVIPKIPCGRKEYEQDPSRWQQTAERYLAVLNVLAERRDIMPEDEEYKPGDWFTIHTSVKVARLRMAANKKRKTKRVRSKVIDGVTLYSVSDARQWWPSDMLGRK